MSDPRRVVAGVDAFFDAIEDPTSAYHESLVRDATIGNRREMREAGALRQDVHPSNYYDRCRQAFRNHWSRYVLLDRDRQTMSMPTATIQGLVNIAGELSSTLGQRGPQPLDITPTDITVLEAINATPGFPALGSGTLVAPGTEEWLQQFSDNIIIRGSNPPGGIEAAPVIRDNLEVLAAMDNNRRRNAAPLTFVPDFGPIQALIPAPTRSAANKASRFTDMTAQLDASSSRKGKEKVPDTSAAGRKKKKAAAKAAELKRAKAAAKAAAATAAASSGGGPRTRSRSRAEEGESEMGPPASPLVPSGALVVRGGALVVRGDRPDATRLYSYAERKSFVTGFAKAMKLAYINLDREGRKVLIRALAKDRRTAALIKGLKGFDSVKRIVEAMAEFSEERRERTAEYNQNRIQNAVHALSENARFMTMLSNRAYNDLSREWDCSGTRAGNEKNRKIVQIVMQGVMETVEENLAS